MVFEYVRDLMVYAYNKILNESNIVELDGWQGDTKRRKFYEYIGFKGRAKMEENIDKLKEMVKPSLPWADIHFNERVSGIPYNPPPSYKLWNHKSGNWMMDNKKIFSHTYPERMWPKELLKNGIRFENGDLYDIVKILYQNPDTRQAYMPMFIHEDLSAALMNERVPCSLGWHFIIRHQILHLFYFLRSVDVIRHLHNDIYLAIRLAIWIKEKLIELSKKNEDLKKHDFFKNLKLGFIDITISSLHCFIEDIDSVKLRIKKYMS